MRGPSLNLGDVPCVPIEQFLSWVFLLGILTHSGICLLK